MKRSNLHSLSLRVVVALIAFSVCASWSAAQAQEPAAPKVEEKKPEPPQSIFPDPQLEAAVRAEVFEKRYNTEPITAKDVERISRVVGRGRGIKSIAGLEHCKAIMLIDLEDNEISDIAPLASLTRLQSVNLAGNKITNIAPLGDLTAMQLLDLSRNQVTSLDPLVKMSNLRSLYLAGNQLTSLDPIAKLAKIWSLDVAGNQLTDLAPVSELGWLTTLDITGNQITSLEPIKGLRQLDLLMLGENKIEDLGVLVEMCRVDAEGERRFAPYLELYLGTNPIDEKKKVEQSEKLKTFGVRIKG